MLTDSIIASFVTLAGDDFTWTDARGGHRPTAKVRPALRLDLAARQGGVCFACGDALTEDAEFCHIVSRGPVRRGWFPGNIAVGCGTCNKRQEERGPIVWTADMARPDVVPMEWTPFPVLKRS